MNSGFFWTEESLADLLAMSREAFLIEYPKVSADAYRQRLAIERPPVEPDPARKLPPQYPSGWEPHVVWNGREGQVIGRTTERPKDWDELITSMGLDPAEVEVVEPVEMRWWDANVGDGNVERLFYAKARIRRRRGTSVDVTELLGHISTGRGRKAPRHQPVPDGSSAYVLGFADLQLGKKGTDAAVDRIVRGIDNSAKRLKMLCKKHSIGAAYIPGLGDLGEACDGFYPMQSHEVELDGREQARLGRRLLTYAIEQHRSLVERTVCPAVGGNHGEKRKDGKAYTSFGDNTDIEVYEQVAEAYELAGAKDVSFVIPVNELTLTLDIGGQIVGLTHGHVSQRTRGDCPPSKMRNWWIDQMAGRRPVADADLLLSAHYHAHWITPLGTRHNVGFPTVDSGSQWWDETHGTPTRSGMLSLVIGKGYPLGFGDWDFT